MKKTFMVLKFILVTVYCFAQSTIELPKDESGQYTFYEVVELQDFPKENLLDNAESFLKYYLNRKHKKSIVKNEEEGFVEGRSSFLVYKKGSLGKNVDGAIEYNIRIDVKDDRYRFTITDFYFQEYERNRYAKFVPSKSNAMPLETSMSALNLGQWEEHKRTVQEKMEQMIAELKIDMLKTKESGKKVIKKDDW